MIACKLLVSLSDPPRGNEYPVDRRGFRGGGLRDATPIMAGMEELEIHSKVLLTFPVALEYWLMSVPNSPTLSAG